MLTKRMLLIVAMATSPCWAGIELNPEDLIVEPGRPAFFVTALERKYTLLLSDDVENATVDFYFGGNFVARSTTDRDGTAVASVVLPDVRPATYEMRAYYKGKTYTASGRVFYWNPRRTVLAVDVDETISHTHYSDLFIADIDKYSKPLDGAPAALQKLSRDYEILYVSARPRFLNQKTREWLAEHGFPRCAVANATKFEACLHQRRYKHNMLIKLRERFPNLLVGIGDKKVDDEAYGANKMLSIIIDKPVFTKYGEHCVVMKDWSQVARFFEDQQARLANARELAAIIESSRMNLRPVFATLPPAERLAGPDPERATKREPLLTNLVAEASPVPHAR